MIRGEVKAPRPDDQVIVKADGFPTYHLANVVDDHEMGITHVVRGEEWISSTPKHVLLYDWLGWERPAFAHMPLLRNTDKSKISKRKNPAARLTWFLEQGYLPEALRNFLALMGYSQPDGEEIFTFDDMVRDFDWHRVNTVGPVFDLDKLELAQRPLHPRAVGRGPGRPDHRAPRTPGSAAVASRPRSSVDLVLAATPLVNERMQVLSEAEGMLGFLLVDDADFVVDPDDAAKVLDARGGGRCSRRPSTALVRPGDLGDRRHRGGPARGAGRGPRAQAQGGLRPVRVAVTGRRVSPPLFESLELLGRDRIAGAAAGRRGDGRGLAARGRRHDGGRAGGHCRTAGDTYPRLLRTPRWRWWRPLLGLLALGFAVVVFGGVVITLLAVIVVDGNRRVRRLGRPQDALDPDTVLGLLANNLILATIIPAAALRRARGAPGAARLAGVGRSAGSAGACWRGWPRWRWWSCWSSTVSVSWCRAAAGTDGSTPTTATLVGLLAVILLTTPLQAAAEEVGFRGYITQAVSSWFARPVVGILVGGAVSAVCFALAHGVQDPWLFADRLCFGVVASWLAWRTGGLEASVALHTANNLVSLVVSAATGTLSDSLTASSLDWRLAALDVAMMVVFALLVDRLAAPLAGGHAGVFCPPPAPVGYPVQRPPTPPPAGRENPWGMG